MENQSRFECKVKYIWSQENPLKKVRQWGYEKSGKEHESVTFALSLMLVSIAVITTLLQVWKRLCLSLNTIF